MRLAMWSGPRNISTAMMYSFYQREDFCAVDEPFYAYYLAQTGLQHPMTEEVLAYQPHEAEAVIAQLELTAQAAEHQYEKHMSQHILPTTPLDWLSDVTNVFLIRHPVRVAASFADRYENPQAADLGFGVQADLFARLQAEGKTPIVLDSADVRRDPEGMLRKLCDALELEWVEAMLSWPKGGCAADGVWAPHWYAAVHGSTGFAGAEGPMPVLDGRLAELAEELMPHYEALYEFRLS